RSTLKQRTASAGFPRARRPARALPRRAAGRRLSAVRVPERAEPVAEPPALAVNGVPVEDTFAEAFPMTGCRLVVTAQTPAWARSGGQVTTGSAASVIGCDAEAAVERFLGPDQTPDGRPGVSLLLFAFSRDALQKAVVNRVGQCVLTCPTTACYNGLPAVKDK